MKDVAWMDEIGKRALEAHRSGSSSASAYLTGMLAFVHESMMEMKTIEEELFVKAQTLIRERLYHNSVSSIAAEMSIDPRTLYGLFRRYAGCSPKT